MQEARTAAKIASQLVSTGNCRYGEMIWPRSDTIIGQSLEKYGEFAEAENRIMAKFVRSGDIAIDVGANLGTTVLPLARAVGPTGHVIAFEPQPFLAQCLHTTLTLNECFHVRVISAALSDEAGWGRIPAPGIEWAGNRGALALGLDGLQVPVMRLDDFELPACALVKIDVEGAEWSVIRGARQHLLRLRPVLYLEAKRIPGTVSYLHWLMDNGWRCYWHFAHFFEKDNFRGISENIFGGVGDMNVLAAPREKAQPEDLPEIRTPEEDWQTTYVAFYQRRQIGSPDGAC